MPGALGGRDPAVGGPEVAAKAAVLGAKLVSVFPQNRAADAPVIQAVVLLFDGADGRPLALIEGGTLTALRTGAATGVATDLLARPDAGIVTFFGAGVQARTQLEAVCAVRPVTQIRIVGRTPGRTAAFAAWARGQDWVRGATIVAVTDPELAVRGAEIVVTATTSPTPVFPGRAVDPGTHVNAVGAFQPTTREVDSDLVARGRPSSWTAGRAPWKRLATSSSRYTKGYSPQSAFGPRSGRSPPGTAAAKRPMRSPSSSRSATLRRTWPWRRWPAAGPGLEPGAENRPERRGRVRRSSAEGEGTGEGTANVAAQRFDGVDICLSG